MTSEEGCDSGEQIGSWISEISRIGPAALGERRLNKEILEKVPSGVRVAGTRQLCRNTVPRRDSKLMPRLPRTPSSPRGPPSLPIPVL